MFKAIFLVSGLCACLLLLLFAKLEVQAEPLDGLIFSQSHYHHSVYYIYNYPKLEGLDTDLADSINNAIVTYSFPLRCEPIELTDAHIFYRPEETIAEQVRLDVAPNRIGKSVISFKGKSIEYCYENKPYSDEFGFLLRIERDQAKSLTFHEIFDQDETKMEKILQVFLKPVIDKLKEFNPDCLMYYSDFKGMKIQRLYFSTEGLHFTPELGDNVCAHWVTIPYADLQQFGANVAIIDDMLSAGQPVFKK